MILNFGEYLPDKPPQVNPGLTVAKNSIPFLDYYGDVNDLNTIGSNALSGICRGAISCRDAAGNVYSYAGDDTTLYRFDANAWVDATTTSLTDYAVQTLDNWEFAQWGNFCLATNGNDPLQEVTIGASNFASVAGAPPVAKHMDVVRDFVVLGQVSSYPYRVQWCGFNNKDTWTAAPSTTQADFQDLNATYGFVNKVVGGEIGTIFQENAITRMLYVGIPYIWQFDTVETGKGTKAPGSVVKVGGTIFYLGLDGFYAFNGSASTNIGAERIYNTFIEDYQSSYYYRVTACSDPFNGLVYWAYPGNGSSAGVPNKILVFNYVANRWAGPIELNVELLFRYVASGYTLDGLDSVSTSIDAITESLDSMVWMGGAHNLGAFDSSHRLSSFTGSPLTAVFETGERQITAGRRSYVNMTRPLVESESASISVAISGRNISNATASFGTDVVANAEGECQMNSEARYHRFRVTVAGGFSHAYGIEAEGASSGRY